MSRLMKNVTLASVAVLIIVLAIASLADALTGVEGAGRRVYGSVPFVLLWVLLAATGGACIWRVRLWRHKATFLLHAAFLLILVGALLTHLFATRGTLHLRVSQPVAAYCNEEGIYLSLPFTIQLDTFIVSMSSLSSSPDDYVSMVSITDKGEQRQGRVAMNKILTYRHYRFYQAGYDLDGMGSTLIVAHDPLGIGVTYSGYLLLLVAMVLFFFQRDSRFRRLLRQSIVLLIFLFPIGAQRAYCQSVPPAEVSAAFGGLYIPCNGRLCSMDSYARTLTIKLYGKPSYRGNDALSVLTGWLVYPDEWKTAPMLKLKGHAVQQRLGIKGRYAAITDFADSAGEYRLQDIIDALTTGEAVPDASAWRAADEKVTLLDDLYAGDAMKIFPFRDSEGQVEWYAPTAALPDDMPIDTFVFIRTALSLFVEAVEAERYDDALAIIAQIQQYQHDEAGDMLPTAAYCRAERFYNHWAASLPWAILCLLLGILTFIYIALRTVRRQTVARYVVVPLTIIATIVFLYLSSCLVLRTILSHHLPLANGYETMQLLAWLALLLTLVLSIRRPYVLPCGFLTAGAALMVAMMGESNPTITALIPVLQSPLLSAHVMVLMMAYMLFAFIMLNGIAALLYHAVRREMTAEVERLRRMSELLLYPAVFLLTAGIFIGAVWANISWGRYWGWDAKEVWALITLLVYALPLHSERLAWFRSSQHFHAYVALAFLTVLMTYFGANALSSLHGYA